MTKTSRARYTLEFKQEAVRLVESGQSIAAAARALGVVDQTLVQLGQGVASENVHEHPLFAKFSIHDSLKVKIATVHSDFWCGNATVPDGICWSAPQSE
jgi:hypothetical protein